ncbi:MAG: hypothetical protein HFJ99_05310 [Eubacterium sp.]|jgi:hypothetical protein|nr:hypothetical protein [Eubacterium sp.]
MTDKELQKHLASYKIEIDEKAKKKAIEMSASAAETHFVPMSIKEFILNQLHYIKPLYPVMCLLFMITVPVCAAALNQIQLILLISLFTPLLSAFAVPDILSQFNSGTRELESSMLYRASAVFSARLVIYGIMNTVCILFSSIFTSLFSGSFIWILLFETMLFTLSALISLLLSMFIQNQYAPVISAAVSMIAAFSVYSILKNAENHLAEPDKINILEDVVSYGILGTVNAAAIVLLAGLLCFLYKHYNFNGGLIWNSKS